MGKKQNTPVAPQQAKEDKEKELELGRKLFSHTCTFVTGAVDISGLPNASIPEIAFAGRSNVGKSSLINALTGQTSLARTSNVPGRTQQINFFDLSGKLILVDLPGYGYAKAPKNIVDSWSELVGEYLKGRQQLVRTCLLIDSRRGFMKSDHAVMKALDLAAVSYLVVLTKVDKLKPSALDNAVTRSEKELKSHVAAFPSLLSTSAQTGSGIPGLRAHLGMLTSIRTY